MSDRREAIAEALDKEYGGYNENVWVDTNRTIDVVLRVLDRLDIETFEAQVEAGAEAIMAEYDGDRYFLDAAKTDARRALTAAARVRRGEDA
jgi:hypothetical protein